VTADDFEHLLESIHGALLGALDALENNDERGVIEFLSLAEQHVLDVRIRLERLKVAR
jgi:hypothetical protein